MVAEEEVAAGIARARPRYWLVDPLDGTRDFAKGRDEYAVCIGLVEDGRAVLGAIALPATGEVFGGLLGAGAWKETAAGRRPIRPASAAGGPERAGQPHLCRRPADGPLPRGPADRSVAGSAPR